MNDHAPVLGHHAHDCDDSDRSRAAAEAPRQRVGEGFGVQLGRRHSPWLGHPRAPTEEVLPLPTDAGDEAAIVPDTPPRLAPG